MLPTAASPDQPAEEGVRRLALTHLETARTARARLGSSDDPEALHDYRVALRRLRSCLRSYRRQLRSTVTRKSRRRVERLAHATNRSRDLEVHLEWLTAQEATAAAGDRPGITWLIGRLECARSRGWREMLALDEARFPAMFDPLHRQLSRYRTTVHLEPDRERRTLVEVTGRRARAAARRLERRLGRIRDQTSEEEIHRARIAAKHLRYLLEPFVARAPAGEAIIERLKSLQDAFGDVHDAHVFLLELDAALREAEGDRPAVLGPGLRFLMASLRDRGARAFDAAAAEWLAPGRQEFFDAVRAARRALASRVQHGREVERKYLLDQLPEAVAGSPSVEIEQGYLPGDRLVERLRRIRGPEGVELMRTVKEGSGLVRLEVEEAVEPMVFETLWPLTEGRRLRKRRYRVPDGDRTWEIDQFLDRDLVLAEVELPSAATEVIVPPWLTPVLRREVTDEPAYGNAELSRTPTMLLAHRGPWPGR
jgi:CHAD domain-containing protein/CYTH domain-containing protein